MFTYAITLAILPTLCYADCFGDNDHCGRPSSSTYVGVVIGAVVFLAFIFYFVKRKNAQQRKEGYRQATYSGTQPRDPEQGTPLPVFSLVVTPPPRAHDPDVVPDLPRYEPPAEPLRYPISSPNSEPRYPPPVYTPPAPEYPSR